MMTIPPPSPVREPNSPAPTDMIPTIPVSSKIVITFSLIEFYPIQIRILSV